MSVKTAEERGSRISAAHSEEVLSAEDVYCGCRAPQFEVWGACCGFLTCALCGTGLECCCCYGRDRPDWRPVCLAGLLMQLSSPCLYGVGAGCRVGLQMMGLVK